MYGQGQMGSNMNFRALYEQLNQVDFISLLGESFSILSPTQDTMIAHLNKSDSEYLNQLLSVYMDRYEQTQEHKPIDDDTIQILKDLLEVKNEHNSYEENNGSNGC